MDLGGTRLRPRSTGRRESHILYWSCHFDLIEASKWFVTTLCNLCNCDCNRQLTTIIIVLFSTALLLCKSLFLVLVVEVKKGNQKVVEVKKKGNKKSGWGHSYSPKWDKWHSGHTVWGLVDVCWALLVLTVTAHFNDANNRPTRVHSVWFSTDAITLAIVATQLSGSGHTIQIHSTASALDHQLMATNWGHQVAAVDTWSCRYKRANMKDGTCVHDLQCALVSGNVFIAESVSQPHRWSIARELTNKSGHKALKANSQRIPQPYPTHQQKVVCPVYWEKYLDFNNFILHTYTASTMNIEHWMHH